MLATSKKGLNHTSVRGSGDYEGEQKVDQGRSNGGTVIQNKRKWSSEPTIDLEVSQKLIKRRILTPTTTKITPSDSKSSTGTYQFTAMDGLLVYCNCPDDPKYRDSVVEHDDEMVIIYDKYPKAKYHFLIKGPSVLNSSHISVIKNMLQKAEYLVDKVNKNKEVPVKFAVGFHAIPSMSQLHLHAISKDMNSPALKTKKHWNSFTTEFFVDGSLFLQMLTENGAVKFERHKYENMLKRPLCCHLCHEEMLNMPRLKAHLLTHDV